MRANEFLEDISRRGFLQGAGAAALGVGSAQAKPVPTETVIVGPGDTVYSIARNFGISPHDIIKANPGMNNNTRLEIDQKIKVPSVTSDPHSISANKKAELKTTHQTSSRTPAQTIASTSTNALQEPGFIKKLQQVANALGIETSALLGIMKHETNNTLSPKAKAPGKHGAIGLIQFIPKTARDLGTSTAELANMSATQQLDYVYKFYKSVGVKPGMDIGDLYMLTFMPAYVGKKPNTVLGKKNGGQLPGTNQNMHAIWVKNPAFSDDHKKPYFTIQDVKNRITQWA
jgi:hypothetical protein